MIRFLDALADALALATIGVGFFILWCVACAPEAYAATGAANSALPWWSVGATLLAVAGLGILAGARRGRRP
mgnify:CR=1 FL=1